MSDAYTIPGGMLCTVCGLCYFNMSMGGPGICPSCDCGNFGPLKIQQQAEEIKRLRAALERITTFREGEICQNIAREALQPKR